MREAIKWPGPTVVGLVVTIASLAAFISWCVE